jgi:hypothetical protein
MFDRHIFELIREYWIADQNHPRRGRAQRPVPAVDDFIALIETCFVASISREEENITKVAVVLQEDGVAVNSLGINQEIIRLENKLPFNQESLVKLSASCDPKISAVIVSRTAYSGSYEICGLMFFGRPDDRFSEIPVGHFFSTGRPDLLIVTVVSPGSMIVYRGGGEIGRFVLGDFIPARPTPFVERAMGDFMISSIRDCSSFQRYENYYWHWYRDALLHLLLESSVRGHGGTIIMIPDKKISECRSGFSSKYFLTGGLRMNELFEQCLSESRDIIVSAAYRRAVEDRLNYLAQLTCVDGALMLSTEFVPITFGATLIAPPWNGKVVVGPDGFGNSGAEFNLERLGTRHNSAASFIGAFPYCYGFVVSQDGPIRGFIKKDEKTIYCWPDCSVSMSVQ